MGNDKGDNVIMEKRKINIVLLEDDDQEARTFEKYLLQYFSLINTTYSYTRYGSAEELLLADISDVDIFFMDIELPGMNGMEAAKRIRKANSFVVIIFLTKIAGFAIEGYEVNALDYILKPLSYSDFTIKVNRALRNIKFRSDKDKDSFPIKTLEGVVIVKPREIDYVEVFQHNLYFYSGDKVYESRGTMANVEKDLAPFFFARCNQSYLLNLAKVTKIYNNEVSICGNNLPMGRSFKKQFISALNDYMIQRGQ